MLDQQDDTIIELSVHIQKLMTSCSSSTSRSNLCNLQSWKFQNLEKNILSMCDAADDLDYTAEKTCHLLLFQEQVAGFRCELSE